MMEIISAINNILEDCILYWLTGLTKIRAL